MTAIFEEWIGERTPVFLGTNHLSQELPFSNWYRFKEAFSPEIVQQALMDHPGRVQQCVDPFSGSGTTALTCQFLGTPSTSFEVNPFLADLARAKVEKYDLEIVKAQLKDITLEFKIADGSYISSDELLLPQTFVEPGKNSKWLFSTDVAEAVFALRNAISLLEDPVGRRLFRVILASSLIENSNVVINGKGRRYRKNWHVRSKTKDDLMKTFENRVKRCLTDIERFNCKSETIANIELQDIRDDGLVFPEFDVSVFSPPYPNSFDYTDVYNVELWMLGYLTDRSKNLELRKQTLTSHLQVTRPFSRSSNQPKILADALARLNDRRERLWDKRIPNMLESYFFEMSGLLEKMMMAKKRNGRIWIVVGDSQYAGVEIETGRILSEIAKNLGYQIVKTELSRKLRTSPQQGGTPRLGETILVLA